MRKLTSKNTGLIYTFTGDGKGKTSAALGVMTRGLVQGWKVGWISWYKEPEWKISEHQLDKILLPSALKKLQFYPLGKGFYIQKPTSVSRGKKLATVNSAIVVDDDTPNEHKKSAQQALLVAKKLIKEVDLLILDEICNAISDKLINESEVTELLKSRQQTHVILTGRSASQKMVKVSDLVSIIHKEKHPFDSGQLAVLGLDF